MSHEYYLVAAVAICAVIIIAVVTLIAKMRTKTEMKRIKHAFVTTLLNERHLSIPKSLAVEMLDALSAPVTDDLVVELYKNRENENWVDLIIRSCQEPESERMDGFIANVTKRNFGEVIMRYLL